MKKFLLLLLVPMIHWCNAQISFGSYVYSFGPQPYTAKVFGAGTIYYTTDGTEPNLNSASELNEVSISISQVVTVKAVLKNSSNQLSQVFSKKYYFGPFPPKTVYFKKPPTWTNACAFSNSEDPQIPLDMYKGPPMTPVCEGWYKADLGFFIGNITFDNCIYPQIPPVYQSFNVVTEDTVFYDYSAGPITNPPACLLAVTDPTKKIAVVKVVPNPVQDFITIESEKIFLSYEVLDVSGKSLLKSRVTDRKIDVSQLTPGNYFIRLNSANGDTNLVQLIKK